MFSHCFERRMVHVSVVIVGFSVYSVVKIGFHVRRKALFVLNFVNGNLLHMFPSALLLFSVLGAYVHERP